MRLRFNTLAPALAALLLAAASTSAATVVYSTTFDQRSSGAQAGLIPPGWTVFAGATADPSGWHLDADTDEFDFNGTGNGAVGYTGTLLGGGPSSALVDYTVEATFRKQGGGEITGLIGRVQNASTFYHARLQGSSALQIYRFTNGSAAQLGSTVATSEAYTAGETWRIEMVFDATAITANVFNELDLLVGTLTVNDAAFASGSAGVRAQSASAFESFQISVVPAPAALPAGLALLGFVAVRRRRRSIH